MINVNKKLRVVHFPQVGSSKESFKVEVKDEEQANLVLNTLANQHLWLEKNNFIPDYSNALFVQMYDNDIDGEGTDGWCDYYNEEEFMDFDEFVAAYLSGENASQLK